MKRAIFAIPICICISSTHALAVDWSLNAALTETTELNDNLFLRRMLAGGTLASYTTITANAVARTPTSRFSLDTDFTYNKYWGGTEGVPLTETTSNGVNAHYETFGKDPANREYVDASWRRQNVALAILSNLGIQTPATGDIDTATLRGGIERDLSARDFASLSARSTLTYYDPSSGGIQFLDTSALATWKHKVSGITSLRASSEAEWLSYNNATNTSILILRNQAGVDLALSPLLDFHGSAGAAYVQASQQGTAVTPVSVTPFLTGALPSGSGSAVGFIGDMTIIYRILKSTTLTFTASKSVAPDVLGSLLQTSSVGTTLAYSINQVSALTFSGNLSRLTGRAPTDFLSATVAYNRLLTREWRANLSYRYLHRSSGVGSLGSFDPITGLPLASGSGPASSNAIILAVSRDFSILPPGN